MVVIVGLVPFAHQVGLEVKYDDGGDERADGCREYQSSLVHTRLWPRLERAAIAFAVPRADHAVAVFVHT